MKDHVIAKRYAKALFEIAFEKGELEPVQDSLETFSEAFLNISELANCLENEEFPLDKRISIIDEICKSAGCSDTMADLLRLMVKDGRISLIRHVTDMHRKLMTVAMNYTEAEISVADEKSVSDTRKRITTLLEQKLGRPARCYCRSNPDIIGGIVLRVNDDILDASVRGRLDQLKNILLK